MKTGAGPTAPEALEEQPKKRRGPRPTTAKWEGPVVHYRVGYTRLGALRWLAHREVIRTFYKLLQRSDLPIRYTEGFHPKAKIGFGPPLPVGAESDHEEMDLYLTAELPADEVAARLGPIMAGVPGLSLKCVERGTGRSAHGERLGARWRVDVASVGGTPAGAQAALARWNDLATPLTIQVDRPDRPRRTVDLRVVISVFEVHDGGATLEFELRSDQGTAKPSEVMAELLGVTGEQARAGRYRLLKPIRKAADAVVAEQVDEDPADEA